MATLGLQYLKLDGDIVEDIDELLGDLTKDLYAQ